MVLIKPFSRVGPWAVREKKRDHLTLCITAPNSVPCIYLRDLEPWIPQQESGHEDPRHHPSSLGKEKRRQAERMELGQASQFPGTFPRRAPGLHSALPEDHSCFFQDLQSTLAAPSQP